MKSTLFAIDGYLSNYQRVSVCDDLITQLRKYFPETKILLLNKYKESFGIEKKVDYYFYYGDGFMVGPTPHEIIDSGKYSRPYVFYQINAGTLENWLPDVGVTDHVANVFNGFLISSNIAEMLGYEKVFRIEYDMLFDEEEILQLKKMLEKFQNEDFMFFGKRNQGVWLGSHLSQIDIHFCGYSTKMLKDFKILKKDSDYWKLCEKIKYWGKFTEYLMSMVFETTMKNFQGSEYEGLVRDRFNKSSFDRISSSGVWENRWLDVPTICRISRDKGLTESPNEILLFYRNNDLDSLYFKVTTDFGYGKEGKIPKNHWFYETIIVDKEIEFECSSIQNNKKHNYTIKINRDNIIKLNNRFIFS